MNQEKKSPEIKAVLFLKNDPANIFLVNELKPVAEISGIVIESGGLKKKLTMLSRRQKKIGTWKVLDQILYLAARALLSRLGLYPSRLNAPSRALQDLIGKDAECLEVGSINDPQVSTLVREKSPDLIVVSGVGIIKRELIESFPGPILNYHAGITPEYRGVYGSFWAIYEGRPDMAGVTIHQIDPGVDTGAIVKQSPVKINLLADTHLSIIEKQFELGIKLVAETVRDFKRDRRVSSYSKPGAKSRLYYHPGLSQLIRFWLKTGMR